MPPAHCYHNTQKLVHSLEKYAYSRIKLQESRAFVYFVQCYIPMARPVLGL